MTTATTDRFYAGTATREEGNRSVTYEWEVGTIPAGEYNREKKVLAVLAITHHKSGVNYFTGESAAEDYFGIVVRNETVEEYDADGGGTYKVRGYMVGSGVGIGRVLAGHRYSAKKLRDAAESGYATFRAYVEAGDERVLKYLADGGASR